VVLDMKTCIEEQRTQLPTIQENASMNSNEQAVVWVFKRDEHCLNYLNTHIF
jgi:hypothetical protein